MIKDLQEKFIMLASGKNFKNSKAFLKFKKSFFSENKSSQPTNADLREIYEELVFQKKIVRNKALEKAMLSRSIRTQSGVAVIAVLTKPSTCPGKCIFCPTEKNMPKSYLSNEPAVMRAIMNKFNPYSQVQSRIKALELNGHSTEKIELIVMGGTFSYFPKSYQKKFISECFRAANDYPVSSPSSSLRGRLGGGAKNTLSKIVSKKKKVDLTHEQKRNEKALHKIVGLTLETRPDYIDKKEILNFRKLGATRVELGIQSVYDNVLEKNNRGHGKKEIVNATKLLKDAGFKINYHMMPGLLGSSYKKDVNMFKELFSNPEFQPDMLKIYPTVVVRNSELYKLWKKGKYKALSDKNFQRMIIDIKNNIIPPYVRIQRLIRDVPVPSIEAGPKVSNLRQIIEKESKCKCIRCREIKGGYKAKNKIILDRIDYAASEGKEIFLQLVSPNKKKLYALLRLRIPQASPPSQGGGWEGVDLTNSTPNHSSHSRPKSSKHIFGSFECESPSNSSRPMAIIREIHTYGKLADISKRDKNSLPAMHAKASQEGPQHIGLGKKLVLEAERVAREEFGAEKIAVISGVGVRNYYRKLGYRLKDTYMIKSL
jgi:elongator complex protein 3